MTGIHFLVFISDQPEHNDRLPVVPGRVLLQYQRVLIDPLSRPASHDD